VKKHNCGISAVKSGKGANWKILLGRKYGLPEEPQNKPIERSPRRNDVKSGTPNKRVMSSGVSCALNAALPRNSANEKTRSGDNSVSNFGNAGLSYLSSRPGSPSW
jgi:hypothetical protein